MARMATARRQTTDWQNMPRLRRVSCQSFSGNGRVFAAGPPESLVGLLPVPRSVRRGVAASPALDPHDGEEAVLLVRSVDFTFTGVPFCPLLAKNGASLHFHIPTDTKGRANNGQKECGEKAGGGLFTGLFRCAQDCSDSARRGWPGAFGVLPCILSEGAVLCLKSAGRFLDGHLFALEMGMDSRREGWSKGMGRG